jgi:hypothetical protein
MPGNSDDKKKVRSSRGAIVARMLEGGRRGGCHALGAGGHACGAGVGVGEGAGVGESGGVGVSGETHECVRLGGGDVTLWGGGARARVAVRAWFFVFFVFFVVGTMTGVGAKGCACSLMMDIAGADCLDNILCVRCQVTLPRALSLARSHSFSLSLSIALSLSLSLCVCASISLSLALSRSLSLSLALSL